MDETPKLQLCHPCKRALHRKAYILLRTSPTSVLRCFRNRHQPGWLSQRDTLDRKRFSFNVESSEILPVLFQTLALVASFWRRNEAELL